MLCSVQKNEITDLVLPQFIKLRLKQYKFVFNASYVKLGKVSYVGIRIYIEERNRIESFLFIWDNSRLIKEINLTALFFQNYQTATVADPKIFILDNQIWGTFNTGHSANNNKLFVFNLKNYSVDEYYECTYCERNKIEKNWVFFKDNNTLHALYSLSPLVVLKAEKKDKNKLIFKKIIEEKNEDFKNFSLGSPLLKNNNTYLFISHKKYFYKGKRLYLGMLCRFSFEKLKVEKLSGFLIYNLKSLLGGKKKFNKNLISCTYFSGLTISEKSDEDLIISYGVNDNSFHISEIKNYKKWL